MARVVQNDKEFKVIALSNEEAKKLGWGVSEGMICMGCNNIIKGEIYYVAVLNDVMDKQCYERWLEHAKNYPEDRQIEDRYFNYYKEELGIK